MSAISKTTALSPQERTKQVELYKQLMEKRNAQKAGEQNPQAGQVDTQQHYQLGALGSVQPTQQAGFVPAIELPKLPERPVFGTVQGLGGEAIVEGNQGRGLGTVMHEGIVDASGVHRDVNDTVFRHGFGHDKVNMWMVA